MHATMDTRRGARHGSGEIGRDYFAGGSFEVLGRLVHGAGVRELFVRGAGQRECSEFSSARREEAGPRISPAVHDLLPRTGVLTQQQRPQDRRIHFRPRVVRRVSTELQNGLACPSRRVVCHPLLLAVPPPQRCEFPEFERATTPHRRGHVQGRQNVPDCVGAIPRVHETAPWLRQVPRSRQDPAPQGRQAVYRGRQDRGGAGRGARRGRPGRE
mmetsp:Transcript_1894/g.2808  ORF Transcript_1894/g.2808 Transcript_1894/m.2808 type:complete len:214 (-) Transcript_1894:1917-2558(-)